MVSVNSASADVCPSADATTVNFNLVVRSFGVPCIYPLSVNESPSGKELPSLRVYVILSAPVAAGSCSP